jgi:hypothetical protein
MKLLAALWLAALVSACVLLYVLGAVEETVEGWRASAAARRRPDPC